MHSVANLGRLTPSFADEGNDYQQINVGIGPCGAAGVGAEKNHFLWLEFTCDFRGQSFDLGQ